MEAAPDDSSVDEALKELEARIPAPVACPCCGETEWAHARDLIVSTGTFAHADLESDAAREDSAFGWAPLRALVLICRNCAFVRQHYVPFVE